MNISFLNLRFDFFSIIAKEVNQVPNNVVCGTMNKEQCFTVHLLRAVAMLFNIFS